MRLAPSLSLLAAVAALVGCSSVVPPSAWSYDPTNPQPRPALATTEAVQIDQRIAELSLQRSEIRSRIAVERDANARLALYTDLHRVGQDLSPLERRLSVYSAAR